MSDYKILSAINSVLLLLVLGMGGYWISRTDGRIDRIEDQLVDMRADIATIKTDISYLRGRFDSAVAFKEKTL